MTVLSVNKVTKIYGSRVKVRAVNQLSLTAEEGEFIAIMGASGSGKTTLLNLIAGILPPTSGEIRIGGRDISKMKEDEAAAFRRDRLGFVFQDYNLVDTLTVGENIMLPLMFQNVDLGDMRTRAGEWARRLNIGDIFDSRLDEVSGGQAQRAAIARAVICRPSLLLADEPTGSLDSASAEGVMKIFSSLNAEENVTTVIVTHDARTASFCRRVVFIRDGKVFSELYREDSQLKFYDEILNVLKFLGGR